MKPPNYRKASNSKRSCGTCKHMGANSMCLLYDYKVVAGNVCDSWARMKAKASLSIDGRVLRGRLP